MPLLYHNSFNLIEADVVTPPVIKLRGAGAGMVRHSSDIFLRAAVLEIGRDPGGPKTVISHLGHNPGRHYLHRAGIRQAQQARSRAYLADVIERMAKGHPANRPVTTQPNASRQGRTK